MGWYNSGAWDDLDGTVIPYVLAELANAINERRDCIGVSRYAWSVNTGSESSPTIGTKSDDLAAADFFGLDLFGNDILQDLYSQVGVLVGQAGIQSTTHCAGFAKTSTNTAIGSDLWTLADIATDCGITQPGTITSIFDGSAANFMRESLDRLIYAVIWPTNNLDQKDQDIGSGTRTYWFRGIDGDSMVDGTADGAFAALTQSFIDGAHEITYDSYIETRSNNAVVYACRSLSRSVLEIGPRYASGSATIVGYPGAITKSLVTFFALRGHLGSTVDFNVLGYGATLPVGSSAGGLNEANKISAEVDISNFSLSEVTNPEVSIDFPAANPFDGTTILGATGVGLCGVLVSCKYYKDGADYGSSGSEFTRLIVDISAELTDQA